MKIKYYLGFMIIFVIAISAAVYFVFPDNFSIAMPSNQKLELPVAIWVAIILSLCFVVSLFFFLWDFLRTKFSSFYYQRDFSVLMDQFLFQSMGKTIENVRYRQDKVGTIAKVLDRFELRPRVDSRPSGVEKIDKFFELLKQINLGYEQDIKKLNLPYDNEFFIKNFMNKFKKDFRIGINAFKSPMPNHIKKEIFIQMLNFIEVRDLQKILDLEKIDVLDKEIGFLIVEFLQKKNTQVKDSYLAEICKKSRFDTNDYLELAKKIKSSYSPDSWLKSFENLSLIDEKAEMGYLFVLCELEMIDLLRQKLASLPKNEFLNVRAYLDLRSGNKNYPLSIFFGKN